MCISYVAPTNQVANMTREPQKVCVHTVYPTFALSNKVYDAQGIRLFNIVHFIAQYESQVE
jgi:hypothetical protein